MDRRSFLHRASLIAAGVVAVDQLELLDRLGWKRRLFSGATFRVQPETQYGRILSINDSTITVAWEDGSATMGEMRHLLLAGFQPGDRIALTG